MFISLLLMLAISMPAIAMDDVDDAPFTLESHEIECPTDLFFDVMNKIKQEHASEHNQAKALPHAQKLFTILENNTTENEIFDHIFWLTEEQIAKLELLKGDLKKKINPAFRKKIHTYLKQQQERSFEKADINKIESIINLFSFKSIIIKSSESSFFPPGYYKTDKSFMVEIDHANIDVGQMTKYGIIVAIHP